MFFVTLLSAESDIPRHVDVPATFVSSGFLFQTMFCVYYYIIVNLYSFIFIYSATMKIQIIRR